MIETGKGNTLSYHLAGIIPVAGMPANINLELPNCMAMIAENYTALERAVFECACAGCESIWVTVNDDWMPLIRKRIGEYVFDPVFYYRQYENFVQFFSDHTLPDLHFS